MLSCAYGGGLSVRLGTPRRSTNGHARRQRSSWPRTAAEVALIVMLSRRGRKPLAGPKARRLAIFTVPPGLPPAPRRQSQHRTTRHRESPASLRYHPPWRLKSTVWRSTSMQSFARRANCRRSVAGIVPTRSGAKT